MRYRILSPIGPIASKRTVKSLLILSLSHTHTHTNLFSVKKELKHSAVQERDAGQLVTWGHLWERKGERGREREGQSELGSLELSVLSD